MTTGTTTTTKHNRRKYWSLLFWIAPIYSPLQLGIICNRLSACLLLRKFIFGDSPIYSLYKYLTIETRRLGPPQQMTLEYTNGIVMNVERMLDSINDQRQKPSLLLVVMKQHQRSLHHGCRVELNSRRSHLPCNLVLLLVLFFLVSLLDNVLFVEGFRSHFPATSNINPTPSSSTTTTSSSNGDTTGGNNKSWDPHQPPTTTTSASSSNTKSDQEDGGSITSSSTERSETASAVEDNGESTMSFSKLSSESSSAHYKHHPISSTVRRWNEVISTTAADAIPSVTIEGAEERSTGSSSITSSSTTEDDDTERLLIVQESDDARYFFDKTKNGITSSSSPGTMLQTTEDDQIMIFGREEEVTGAPLSKTTKSTTKNSSSIPATISIPTFGSPNAFQFNYKRYHSSMTPPTQLFHTVVLGEDTTSLLKKSKKRSTSSSPSRLYSSTTDDIDDVSSTDTSTSPSEKKSNQNETFNNFTGASSNTMHTSNHENQSSILRKNSSNNNIANGSSSSSSLSSMEGTTTTTFRVSASTPTNKPLWHYWRPLLRMCRLRNLPGVALFHLIAVHLIHRVAVTGGVSGDVPSFIELIFNPGSIATLMVTMLIACISMLFNDYYDAKSGVDLVNMEKTTTSGAASALAREAMNDPMHPYHAKPLVTGEVPLRVARQFITLMAIAVLSLTMVLPGIAPKFAALFSGVIVYYYTDYLKPKTWIKNISCASLIAASPLVSALAAWHTMVFSSYRYKNLAAGVNVMITGTTLAFQIMSRLMICIFSWSMSREIIMDIADHKGDKMVGIQTVPVRYGKRFASKAALVFASCLSISALSGPLMELVLGTTTSSTNGGASIYVLSPVVRFILALLSSGWMMYHTNRVVQDEGVHDKISQDVVETTMIPAVLALASFI